MSIRLPLLHLAGDYKVDVRLITQTFEAISVLFNKGLFVDRGDPSAYDFTLTDFTTDGNWKTGANALDLSGIVDVDAKAVLVNVSIQDGSINQHIQLRESGNSNAYNKSIVRTQVSNQTIDMDMIIGYNSDQKIEYQGANTTFTGINMVVRGWWK